MYVPDNYDAWEAHDAEQQAWLNRRPKCEKCGEPIQDDYLYDLDGIILCEECMNHDYRKNADDYEKEI